MGAQTLTTAEQLGASSLAGEGWSATVLDQPPLIAPARQFTFPFAIAGEEDALARGALWLQVRVATGGGGAETWLAQCALGFAGGGVARGLWPMPNGALLACAGGYAYAITPAKPEQTILLPPRPAVAVLTLAQRTVLVTHHALVVREADGEVWTTPRLSWEGLSIATADEDTVEGLGWDMVEDRELPFTVGLAQRTAKGGGYSVAGSGPGSERR